MEITKATQGSKLSRGQGLNIGLPALSESLEPRSTIQVVATKDDGCKVEFDAIVRIDTPIEMDYYRNGKSFKPYYEIFYNF